MAADWQTFQAQQVQAQLPGQASDANQEDMMEPEPTLHSYVPMKPDRDANNE